MEDDKFYTNASSMQRMMIEARLMCDGIFMHKKLAEYKGVLPKSFRKKFERRINSDISKGLRIINRRCPVYIELPKLESVGNGAVKEVDPKTNEPITDEVKVTPPIIAQNRDIIEYDD